MKPPHPTGVLTVSLLVLAGCLITAFIRLQEWTVRHAQVRVLRTTLAAQTAEPTAPPHQAPPPSPPDSDLSETERMELFRLRGEWLPLRRRAEKLAPLEQANADLKQRLAHARAHPEDVAPLLPPGYFLAKYARNVGQATPEAALETLLWAIERRDMETLLRIIVEEEAKETEEQLRRMGEENFWKKAVDSLSSIRILDKLTKPDGTIELSVMSREDRDGSEPVKQVGTMYFHLIDGQWRFVR